MTVTFHTVSERDCVGPEYFGLGRMSNGNTDWVATFYVLKVKMCHCATHEVSLEMGRSRGLLCPYTVHFEGSCVRVIAAMCNSSKSLAVNACALICNGLLLGQNHNVCTLRKCCEDVHFLFWSVSLIGSTIDFDAQMC